MQSAILAAVAGAAAMALIVGHAAAQSVEDGEQVFRSRCGACHATEPGKHRTGPSLYGVVGREAGSTDFRRYVGLQDANFVWNVQNLIEYLKDPAAFVKANTRNSRSGMMVKLPAEQDRAAVVAYLKTLQ